MKRSTDRIITTHVGSLPRPHDLLEVLNDKVNGRRTTRRLRSARQAAINDVVKQTGRRRYRRRQRRRAEQARLLRLRPGPPHRLRAGRPSRSRWRMARPREIAAFPDYYGASAAGGRQRVGSAAPVVCRGPVSLRGARGAAGRHRQPQGRDAGPNVLEGFMPAIAPRGVGNERVLQDGRGVLSSPRPTPCTRSTPRSSRPASSCRSTTPG